MEGWRWGLGTVLAALSCAGWGQGPQAGCASTPAAAIEAARAGQVAGSAPRQTPELRSTGFRVESVRWDATQRQTWAVIRSCDHAERPTLAMLADLPHGTTVPPASGASVPVSQASALPAQIALANTATVVVHAGEAVRLWLSDGQAHIELTAVAEENGAVGAKVRLRLMTPTEPDGPYVAPRYFAGIVRGPADVEMER